MSVEWCELERTDLVERIAASLRSGTSVLLTGEAGVGKTTVARQAAPEESVWLQGLEGLAGVALAPFALVGVDPPLDSVGSAYRWLREQAEGGVTLVVDDAQWIDPVSSGLLAQAITHDRIRAIVSVRSGHAVGEDLIRAITGFDRITVESLDASMVELALELTLDSDPGSDVAEVFWQRSGGNPLYLRELVMEAVSTGALTRTTRGIWRLDRAPSASASLAQQIASRLSRLDTDARRGVDLVVVADHLPDAVLAELVDRASVATALDAALLVERDGEVYPSHPIIADAVAAGLSSTRRAALTGELVDASVVATSHDLGLRRLKWRLDLGDVPTIEDLETGYAAAVRSSNLDLAGRIAMVAHDHHPNVMNGLRAANQLHRDGRHRDATQLVESLVPMAASSEEAALIASHLLRTQGRLGLHLGTNPAAGQLDVEILDWAESQVEGQPFTEIRRSADALSTGDAPGALRHLEPLLEHPLSMVRHDARERLIFVNLFIDERESYRHAIESEAMNDPYLMDRPQLPRIYWLASRSVGAVRESLERTRADFDQLDQLVDTTATAVAHAHALMCLYAGRISEAFDAIRVARALCIPGSAEANGVLFAEANALSLSGQVDRADKAMSVGLETARRINDPMRTPLVEVRLWFHRAAYGTHREAVDRLRDLGAQRGSFAERDALWMLARLALVDEPTLDRVSELGADGGYASAVAILARAHLDGDTAALVVAADHFEEVGTFPEALEALAAAVKIHQAVGRQTEAKHLARRHQDLLAQCPGLRWPLAAIAVDAPELTGRETQVCELAALGWSNRQIADELTISVRTVENNLQRAYSKLGVHRRTELGVALGLQPA